MGKGEIRTPGPERIEAADRETRTRIEQARGDYNLEEAARLNTGVAGSRETVDLPLKRGEKANPVAS